MARRGYEGMTIEGVAQASGAAKTTIYRWWPGRAALAVEAFLAATEAALALPDSGAARDDFRAQVAEVAALLAGDGGRVMAAMLAGARADPLLEEALRTRWLAPRRAWGFARMVRAIAEGQCRAGVDPVAALGLLYGPLYAPLMFGEPAPSGARLDAHLDLALGAVFR